MHIAITGATGYIGEALTRKMLECGYQVRSLSRKWLDCNAAEYIHYDLSTPLRKESLDGTSVVVHLACHTYHYTRETHDIELNATKNLLEATHKKGAFFLYVSSLSAISDAPTQYGRTKYAIEQYVIDNGGTVIRPGVVYGGNEKGLYGFLCSIVRKYPLLPNFYPRLNIQPIYIEDLCLCIVKIIEHKLKGTYDIAQPFQISLTRFLKLLAEHKMHKKRIFIPCPWPLWLMCLKYLKVIFPIQFDPERLRSLNSNPYVDTYESLKILGIELTPIDKSFV